MTYASGTHSGIESANLAKILIMLHCCERRTTENGKPCTSRLQFISFLCKSALVSHFALSLANKFDGDCVARSDFQVIMLHIKINMLFREFLPLWTKPWWRAYWAHSNCVSFAIRFRVFHMRWGFFHSDFVHSRREFDNIRNFRERKKCLSLSNRM